MIIQIIHHYNFHFYLCIDINGLPTFSVNANITETDILTSIYNYTELNFLEQTRLAVIILL